MWLFTSKKHEYKAVAGDETEFKDAQDFNSTNSQLKRSSRLTWRIGAALLTALLVAAGILVIIAQQSDLSVSQQSRTPPGNGEDVADSGTDPGLWLRREWRTLADSEKHEYISAVLCLLKQPSELAPETNYTAYDDWPWIHSHVGYATHHSATFLPWHRYFLHLYETTLRDKCGYDGGLVYWDWTLDHAALEGSPVFDPGTGFGGDGEVDGNITVSNTGRCVVDGPFAGVIASFYDVKFMPHCLSRGFRDLDGSLGHIDGSGISPEEIEQLLSLETYEEFVVAMERQVHDVIPYGISGDFETFTAPYGRCCSFLILMCHF